ncbi:Putative protein [Zobellia galactanivorans]|uniref:Uncharacterized protein n=1 Tax=Zobellia galactanivorans (strain DSM 12802 / CCUG 47099 / CIP 106680 / NCIMB 13871 / Dsij) TaxID=63186 RepID=G0L8H0_ZOBGA|nr:Putative protein [Zobellia galactanivorans]
MASGLKDKTALKSGYVSRYFNDYGVVQRLPLLAVVF